MNIQIRMYYIAQLGMMAAAAGAGMIQDLWQQNLNRKAEDRGKKNSKELMDYQTKKQLEMWEKTGYGAQMEQLRKAGLNPGLLYGMGGAGGQTTGSAGATMAGIPTQSGMGGALGMGMQMGMMEAQRKVLESQAKLNEAQANKTAGVDTQAGQQNIAESKTRQEALLQGIDNERQRMQLMKIEERIQQMEAFEKQKTQEDRIGYILYQNKQAMKELELLENEAYISDKTLNDKVKIIKQEAIGAVIRNEATKAGIELTKEQISNLKQSIRIAWENNMQGYTRLDQEQQKIAIEKLYKETIANQPSLNQVGGSVLNEIKNLLRRVIEEGKIPEAN